MKLPNAERAVVDIAKLRDLGVESEGVVGAGLAEAGGRWGEKRVRRRRGCWGWSSRRS